MNERLQELAEQAGFYITIDGSGIFIPDPHTEDITEVAKKFAELIVRECAGLAVNSQYANTKSEYYEGFNEALVYVGNKFKQHFGVEE